MEILNLIEIKNNEVTGITSFVIPDEQLSSATIQEAEEYFTKRLKELNVADEDVIEDAIEDGVYQGANFSLSLVWSYADNIQF